MNDLRKSVQTAEQLEQPVTIAPEAYTSREYARAERDGLWRKAWLQASSRPPYLRLGI